MTAAKHGPPADLLVVIGSSAGGIEALSTVMSGLEPSLPAAVILAQHLDPARRSHLAEILQRKAALPVVLLEGPTPLAAGTVYVVPADRNVTVSPGTADLVSDGEGRSHPSIDVLMTTAAAAYGERLFAVVLTGNGSDGANGAVAVKQAGGTVIIQDPRSAAHPSMPRALPPTAVDHVAPLDRIGPLLGDLVARAASSDGREDAVAGQLASIVRVVGKRSNIDFRPYKTSTVLRRIERRMTAVRAGTLEDYTRHLETHPEESGALVKALLIKVTEFFRDPEAFEYLRRDVLPGIVDRARADERRVRVWSAGCATGEEAYSLAMTLADLVGPEIAEWSIRVFATDLNEEAVAFARRGVYPAAMLANVPADYRARFFEAVDAETFRVVKGLRQMVIYGQQDLSRGVPFPRIDLVVCRNLLIYFQPELQEELLQLFAYSLHETGGILFLGKAETARPSNASFEIVSKKWKIYRCLTGPTTPSFRSPVLSQTRFRLGATSQEEAAVAAPADTETVRTRRFDEAALRSMQAGVVVVDRQYRTVSVNAAARRLLGIRDHGPERDFLHSVRGIPYAEVRAAIDGVLRDGRPVTLREVSLGLGDAAEPRFVSLSMSPLSGDVQAGDDVVITVTDATDSAQNQRKLEAAEVAQKRVLDDLNETNARLNATIKDLQDSNEELQAANEELMLAQEELQATNEEFEATNEELQATNEELETNNEELQATNEELDTTNEELQARTAELEELTSLLHLQRERLAEIVEKAPVPLAVVRGSTATLESFNQSFAAMLGRPVAAGSTADETLGALPDVVRGLRDALERGEVWVSGPQQVAGSDGSAGRSVVFTALPLYDGVESAGVLLIGQDVAGGR